ncbi:DNA-3-methyladenine glycosylase [Bacillus sp. MRMR6]|uniref:DNA-3-methyladenine glycosylase family protein n=1 Tax=Bacillus sp. MRMR6 TaxID=1928617 RepID=UPI000952D33F|nr:DNA-3-methyladenine glycosylase [Bacillus sp. MRMR6]OLS33533.1 DNA-3-methyladenine glycosylase [Bacillus sp. MRMR6]
MWQETIRIEGPFNFDRVLERHSIDPLKKLSIEERWIKVPVIMGSTAQVVEIQAIGTTAEPAFILKSNGTQQEAAIQRINEIFQWNTSLTQIHDYYQKTDLKPIFEEHYGTPLVLDFELFGALVKLIIHQQLNMSFAHTLTERFVHNFGYQLEDVWFFPKPETVASLKVEKLRELQFSGRKAEYVIDIAKAVVDNGLDLEALKDEPDEEIFNQLIKIRGIGAWTIENFLLFGLGRPNLFPIADIGIQNAIKKLYGLEKKPTKEEMEQYKQAWDPYLSYASLYLWRSIE